MPEKTTLSVRKKWIGFVAHAKGYVVVDEGAKSALQVRHTSLLPSGIVDVFGTFEEHDTIAVRDPAGREIARGVSRYSSTDLLRVKGKRTGEIRKLLDSTSKEEVIHKDNLVLLGE